MSDRDNMVYLQHMLDAIHAIEEYTQDIDEKTFFENRLIQDGVIRQIEIIGEASKDISADLKDKYSSVPWKDIAGMRDKLSHDYFGVDLGAVWETVTKDLPELKKAAKLMLGESGGNVKL